MLHGLHGSHPSRSLVMNRDKLMMDSLARPQAADSKVSSDRIHALRFVTLMEVTRFYLNSGLLPDS
jgi:hypothetical protein